MGSFFGVAFINNTKSLSENELGEKLRTVPKASNAINISTEMRNSLAAKMQTTYMKNKTEIDKSFAEQKARYNEMQAPGTPNPSSMPPIPTSMEDVMASISSLLIGGARL